VDKKINNDNTESHVKRTLSAVLRNLSELEAAPSVEFKEAAGRNIDAEALFYRRPPQEDDDPMERLHWRCGEMEERGFFMEMGNGSSTWPRTTVAATTSRTGRKR